MSFPGAHEEIKICAAILFMVVLLSHTLSPLHLSLALSKGCHTHRQVTDGMHPKHSSISGQYHS
jgi:hypothetical protein